MVVTTSGEVDNSSGKKWLRFNMLMADRLFVCLNLNNFFDVPIS